MTPAQSEAKASLPPAFGQSAVCLFAQYDRSGGIPAHTRRYLAELSRLGLSVHVACSGVEEIRAGDLEFLRAVGATGLARPNRGLDFGAWRDLMAAGRAAGAPRVVLANDSVFGPFGDLRAVVAAMQARRLDAWGLVESRERVWHLQSWFVCLSAAALEQPAVQRVFAQDFPAMGKEEIILHGELGLGVALREAGLTTGAVWEERSRLRRLMPANPSHFDWRSMLVSGRVPFIKAELLRDNPANISWLGEWREVVAACPGGDPALIDAALIDAPLIDAGLGAELGAGAAWRPPLQRARLLRRLINVGLTRDRWPALRSLLRRPC